MRVRSIPLVRRLDDSLKFRLKELAPGWILSRVRPNAIREPRRRFGDGHGKGVPLFGMVCTWLEEDIIFASVRNAFDLGASRVFLLDNGSPDNTIAEAVAAGAEHVLTFKTDSFDEILKFRLINEYIESLSRGSGHGRVWWLMFDADEFVRSPHGVRLDDFLKSVDSRCRVLGARVLDHFPQPGTTYEPRTDPKQVQAVCREKVDHRCIGGHHKHPIFLWDADRRRIEVEPGFHQLRCWGEALFEPSESVFLDHYPYRNEEASRRRLELLAQRGTTDATRRADADGHMRARRRSLDDVYAGRYENIIDYQTGQPGITVVERTSIA